MARLNRTRRMNAKDYRAGGVVYDAAGNPVGARPESWNRKEARRVDGVRGLAQDTGNAVPRMDYVYDPITGMPIPDPSGELQNVGYEKMPADAALAIGDAAAAAAAQGFSFFTKGVRMLFWGTVIVGGVIALAEGSKLGRDAFGSRRR